MTRLYFLFAILGTIVPYLFFGDFVLSQGIDIPEFVRQIFANSPAGGFTTDLLITSAAFWIWSFREARRRGMRCWWIYVSLNLTVGLSCALPLFLAFRQLSIEQSTEPVAEQPPFGRTLTSA